MLEAQPGVLEALAVIAQPSALCFETEDLRVPWGKNGISEERRRQGLTVTQTGLTDHFPGVAPFCLEPHVCKPDRPSLLILWEVVPSCMVSKWGLILSVLQKNVQFWHKLSAFPLASILTRNANVFP